MKQTSTASRLIFVRPPSTTILALAPASLSCHPSDEPFPLLRDVGIINTASAPSEARKEQPPLPFPKGCGRVVLLDDDPGREDEEGEPMKWEASLVSYETRATTFVVVRFRYPPSLSPSLTPPILHQDETTPRSNEDQRMRGGVSR